MRRRVALLGVALNGSAWCFGWRGRAVPSIDRARLAELLDIERARFVDMHPKSNALFQRAKKSLLAG